MLSTISSRLKRLNDDKGAAAVLNFKNGGAASWGKGEPAARRDDFIEALKELKKALEMD